MRLCSWRAALVVSSGALWSVAFADVVPRIERWELHTSLLTVRSVASDGERFWAATSGGLFTYEPRSGAVGVIRKTEGLLVQDLTALAADTATGLVTAGAFDGTLELYERPGRWEHLTEIRNEPGIPDKRVHAITIAGRYAYVAAAFGLVVIDLPARVVAQVVPRIGPLPVGTPVYAVSIWQDSIWVGTGAGLAVAPVNAPLLNYPSAWRAVQGAELSGPIYHLSVADSMLLVATHDRVLRYTAGTVTTVREYSSRVVGMGWAAGRLWVATQAQLWQELPYRQQLSIPVFEVSGLWVTTVGGEVYILVGASEQGLWYWDWHQWKAIQVNTPHTNLLFHCAVDLQGNAWCATWHPVDRGAGRGFAALYRGSWYAFTVQTHPWLGGNEYFYALALPSGGEVWFSNWGRGLLQLFPR
ncbi:MAG: hypothetical protein NZ949_05880, partial [Candidatus Kapabacteria bacterium]|nr:hypothetical protein [Candidatus Kapabacteria bacterium]MDW7996568.1 hypothetical protein [Bacteroidota bacterium]